MRLIDADAEIKKIEEEIKRSYKAIDRWRSGGMPGSSLYDIDEKVRRIKRNIEDCRMEIKMLKSYTTAYNPEAIVNRRISLMKLPIIQQKITYRHIQKQLNW